MATKSVKVGILRIRYDTNTPFIAEGACKEVLTTGVRSVMTFWENCTYGYLDLSESVMFPWLDVTFGGSDVQQNPQNPGVAVLRRERQAEVAIAALRTSQPGSDPLAGIDALMVLTLPGSQFTVANPLAGQPMQPASLTVDLDGGACGVERWPTAVIPLQSATHTFATHELGHALGLMHSYGLPNQGANWDPVSVADDWLPVYGSPYDIMSGESFGGVDPRHADPYSPAAPVPAPGSPAWPYPSMATMGPALSCAYLHLFWPDALTGRVVQRTIPAGSASGSERLRHTSSSGEGNVALELVPANPSPDGLGTIVVEYRQAYSWDAGLSTAAPNRDVTGVVVHTFAQTSEGIRPWYQGTVAEGAIDSDVVVPGSGVVIRVREFRPGTGEVSVEYLASSTPELLISSVDRADTVADGAVTREETTPCGDRVHYGRWRMSARETFAIRVRGLGTNDPGDTPIGIVWTVGSTAVPTGPGAVLVYAGTTQYQLTTAVDPVTQSLTITTPPGAPMSVAVTATATDAAGVVASGTELFESPGVINGIRPEHLKYIGMCIERNIPHIPVDFTEVLKRPSREPQYLQDLWSVRAVLAVNELERLDVDEASLLNVRRLVDMQLSDVVGVGVLP